MALVSYKRHPILHELSSSIRSPEDRTILVTNLLEKYSLEGEPERVRNAILEILSNYIIFAAAKYEKEQTRKQNKDIVTPSKASTIKKREISIQGLQETAEYDEVIESHINEDRNTLLTKHLSQKVTDTDKQKVPFLANIDECIQNLRYVSQNNVLTPKKANVIKQIVIELESDKYIIKEAYRKPISCAVFVQSKTKINWDCDTGYFITQDNLERERHLNQFRGADQQFKLNLDPSILSDDPEILGYHVTSKNTLNWFDPKTWCELIKLYAPLKESSWEESHGDLKWIIKVFEQTIDRRFKKNYPIFFDMICWRIDKLTNKDISTLLEKKYNKKHNDIYVSTTLTKTIPANLALEFERNWILHMFNKPFFLLSWKRCSICGQIKPRIPFFWTRNSSGDLFYSKCKECRNGSTSRAKVQEKIKINEDFDEAAFIDEIRASRQQNTEEPES